MKLIFGLGNPGKPYIYTRHNIGFLTIDRFLQERDLSLAKEKFNSIYSKSEAFGEKCIFAKPLTFMNKSGIAVSPFYRNLKITPDDLIVIHDDVDIEDGLVRIKKGGGDGGHKGLRSIIEQLGGESDFLRIRVGIGRPPTGREVSDFVLEKASKNYLKDLVDKAVPALEALLESGYQKACNLINK